MCLRDPTYGGSLGSGRSRENWSSSHWPQTVVAPFLFPVILKPWWLSCRVCLYSWELAQSTGVQALEWYESNMPPLESFAWTSATTWLPLEISPRVTSKPTPIWSAQGLMGSLAKVKWLQMVMWRLIYFQRLLGIHVLLMIAYSNHRSLIFLRSGERLLPIINNRGR